jgi:hypothetical protein
MPPSRATQEPAVALTGLGRTALSLGLFIHLFLVFVALTAGFAPSALQLRILQTFALYTRSLNFDLNFTPYYLTHATIQDVDHRLEVLPAGKSAENDADWLVVTHVGWRGGDRFQRHQRLARVMSFFAEQDEVEARLAQAVGVHFLKERGIRLQRVRCRKHMLQAWQVIQGGTPAQRDPNDPTYFRTVYEASYVIGSSGTVSVVKITEKGESAQPAPKVGGKNAASP